MPRTGPSMHVAHPIGKGLRSASLVLSVFLVRWRAFNVPVKDSMALLGGVLGGRSRSWRDGGLLQHVALAHSEAAPLFGRNHVDAAAACWGSHDELRRSIVRGVAGRQCRA